MRRYLDAKILARLKGLELKAKLVVEGNVSGEHKSPYKGFSVEFAEHKSYFPGDDIRYIDWKIYGKTEKFFIKQYEEDTNLKCHILLDTSASMGFVVKSKTKLEYSIFMAVALSYLMLSQRDSVGLVAFNNEVTDYIPPRNDIGHLHNIADALERLSPSMDTGISLSLKYLASKIKRRGLIILLSDLIDDQTAVLNHIRYLRYMKHEVIVFHVIHPDEIALPYNGIVRFKNMERQEHLTVITDSIRKSYRDKLDKFISNYQNNLWREGVYYHKTLTNIPVETAILDFISKRKNL